MKSPACPEIWTRMRRLVRVDMSQNPVRPLFEGQSGAWTEFQACLRSGPGKAGNIARIYERISRLKAASMIDFAA
jgi:hypothetical protein